MRRVGTIIATLFVLLLVGPQVAWGVLPAGIEPIMVTATQWDLPTTGGPFRADGTSALDKNGVYSPEDDDRFDVEYRQGLRITFYNVGEQGGEQFAEARVEVVREYLSAGQVIPKARPTEIGKPVGADSDTEMVPGKGIPPTNAAPLYFMRFTGGPTGTFSQTGGQVNPEGPVSGQIVREQLDGLHYIELRPLYLRMAVDDPSAFRGWPGEDPLAEGPGSLEDTAVAAMPIAYKGRVSFLYPDGGHATLKEDTKDRTRERIPLGTIVSTGGNSFIEFEYTNGARYILGPHSSVELLQREAYGARLRRGRALVWHPEGSTKAVSLTAMNFGIIGGDGAEWQLTEGRAASAVSLLSGIATFSVIGSPDTAELEPGQMITATKDGLGKVRAADTNEIKAEWKALRQDAIKINGSGPLSVPGVLPGAVVLVIAGAVGLVVYGRKKGRSSRRAGASPPAEADTGS